LLAESPGGDSEVLGLMRRARAVALTGAALTLAAFGFDAAPLFVTGLGFFLIGALVPGATWLAARGARVTRSIDADHALEGELVRATIEVRGGVFGLPGAVVNDPVLLRPIDVTARPTLRPAANATTLTATARFDRRGRHRLPAPELILTDPLGLATITRRGAPDAHGRSELLVLPRTEPVRWRIDTRARRRLGGDLDPTHAEEPLAAVDVDGLRPYREGTPASRINWPALARGRGLQERRLSADASERPLVVLDARIPPGMTSIRAEPYLDALVRAAASLTLELARAGGCRLLLPGDRRPTALAPDLRGWPALHIRLALIGEDGEPVPAPARAAEGAGGAGLFYLALTAPGHPPARMRRTPGTPAALVVPTELASSAQTPSFTVAGCDGYATGIGRARRAARGQVAVT
jgi:uncharacterized protein (DUF58 family)